MATTCYRSAALAALFALAACKAVESGNIHCDDDSNCPKDYPQCINSQGAGSGRCTEAVSGTPGLAAAAITVAPVSITGGLRPAITLALPALTGSANLARKITLEIDSGGTKEAVVKTDGTAVTLTNLGTPITVDAPATVASDSKTFT